MQAGMRIFAQTREFLPFYLAEAPLGDTVFAGTGTDEVFSCRSRLMDGGVYVAPVNLPFHKDP